MLQTAVAIVLIALAVATSYTNGTVSADLGRVAVVLIVFLALLSRRPAETTAMSPKKAASTNR